MPNNRDRIFQGKSTFPEHEEWFYRAREGVAGPYLRREDAVFAMGRFIQYCRRNRLTGGRQEPGPDRKDSPWAGAWARLAAGLDQAAPVATWLLGVLFGRLSGG
jgi:hypothetical protein